ncbi:relaxase/mobilization nuclease domain-containing protein [Campylobacter ureolyticus]|uniref:relaxase/mobilization nuclease domain-containing protein n=1 Tax=Campylobacter ureolyticus TaxID=827 RepID=UPI0022B2EE72|nr:relaxase/mobilization nuclease domain-containing protein [Campylobacter ureolyticus]MCZ6158070.1 relaxase/mobilization nuclease domain-containing protein [Campylobacter ureolyticus]
MIVKFFKNKNGGSVKGIDYLLNYRVKDGSASLLKGYLDLTKNIIKNINKKQKVCIGCLSFEEVNIEFNKKIEIMNEFERLIFNNTIDEYNILWVEHRDKGRLELNFVIPKINLKTKKSFNPYWCKKDFYKVDSWQNSIKLRFGFSNPKDPKKEHFLKGSRKTNLDKKYLELEQNINLLYKNGKFKCRDDLISFIKDSGFIVTRIGKDYISLRCLGAKKSRRFKGEIFNEEFIDLNSLNELKKQKEEKIEKYENINKGKIDESNSYRANSIAKSREQREGIYADIRSVIKDIDEFRKRYERFAREYGENESCIRQYVESTSGVLSAFMEKTKLVKDNYSDMDLEI